MDWNWEGESRGVEASHEHVERGRHGMGRKEEGVRGQREGKKEEGASSPFYRESVISGCCQVTVGRNLDKILRVNRRI